jgi:hypothetical protein
MESNVFPSARNPTFEKGDKAYNNSRGDLYFLIRKILDAGLSCSGQRKYRQRREAGKSIVG